MSYSHYLPADKYSYRYNAVSRRPVSPGFNERTNLLLNSNYSTYNREELRSKSPHHSRYDTTSRDQTPFQTANYIPTKAYDRSSNMRRSGHFYMTDSRVEDKYERNEKCCDYDYHRDNKVNLKFLLMFFTLGISLLLDAFAYGISCFSSVQAEKFVTEMLRN